MELIPLSQRQITGQSTPTVNGRDLYAFLGARKRFADWVRNRIEQYGFIENQDFILVSPNGETKTRGGDRRSKDYYLSLEMAKELAMVERTEKGQEARRYFIECERRLRDRERAELEAARSQAAALPVPAPPSGPTKAVYAAINRLAHAWSLASEKHTRDHLEKLVQRWTKEGKGEREMLDELCQLDGGAAGQVPIDRRALYRITAMVAAQAQVHKQILQAINALEEQTGLCWYDRLQIG